MKHWQIRLEKNSWLSHSMGNVFKKSIPTRALWCSLISLVALVFVSYLWFAIRPLDRGIMRYARAVTNSVDPHALQSWAQRLLQNPPTNTFKNGVSTKTVPPIVRAIPNQGFLPAQINVTPGAAEKGFV